MTVKPVISNPENILTAREFEVRIGPPYCYTPSAPPVFAIFARQTGRHGSLLVMDEITVVVLGDPAEPTLKKLDGLGSGVTLKVAKTADALGDSLAEARVLFNWSGGRAEIGRALEKAPRLAWIHTRSAGLDSLLFPELIE